MLAFKELAIIMMITYTKHMMETKGFVIELCSYLLKC